jgi:hypothetical protein
VSHPGEDALVEVLVGAGSDEDRRHLDSCRRCQDVLEPWRQLVGDLSLLCDCALAADEYHRLATACRAYGPVRPGLGEWVARLVRSSSATPLAVRGEAGQVLTEHEAGPYHLVMQVRSVAATDEVVVHGQVNGPEAARGELVVSDESGVVAVAEVDELGEFSVTVPDGRCYTATVLLPAGRLVVDRLALGCGDSG